MKGHFDEVKPGMMEIEWLGGELALARIRAVMDELEPNLAPCPFCGSRTMLRGVFMYQMPAVLVECPRCRCRTNTYGPQFDYLTGKNEAFGERCVKRAAAAWNRRTEATA